MLSRTEPQKSAGSCGTMPIAPRRSPNDSARTSCPSSVMRPAVTSQKRGSSDAIVVLPAPERPTSATISPGAARSVTPCSTSGSSGA